MKVYQLKRQQILPISLGDAWDFFSTPKNLEKITPDRMTFKVTRISGTEGEMYAGQLICYELNIIPRISTFWMTEITHIHEPYYFIDEQRFGPYALWNHQHHFREVPGGVEMTDELMYAIPFGWIGRLANWLYVGREVENIFDYRRAALERLFPKKMTLHKTA
jgi:ligand-binding SRPBCC domain-containing protein